MCEKNIAARELTGLDNFNKKRLAFVDVLY